MSNVQHITGTWSDITLVCMYRHTEPVPMVIKQGPSSLFYACPKYDMENLVDDERQCNNRLNLLDHDKMLAHIDKIRYDTELSGEIAQIAHHTWKTSKGIEYKVLSHKGDSLVVGVINKMAINK